MLEYWNMKEKSTIPKIIKKSLPSLVSITISKYVPVFENPFGVSPSGFENFFSVPKGKKKVKVGGGSGFIVDSSGIILTNRHVVTDPKAEYLVFLGDNKKYKAKVLARDLVNDVAVLKINANNLPAMKLGSSSKLELGQPVIAIGNTLGIFKNTVSTGIVSGLSREIQAMDVFKNKTQSLKGLIQTDAAINPGNSGGPLIDEQGKVIGINCAVVFGAENIGFAIPINTAKKDLQEIKKYGRIRQPFLGVRYLPIYKELQKQYELPVDHGVIVISEPIPDGEAVTPNSPASLAGVKEGDIILEINRKKITPKNTLIEILQDCKIGKEIDLKVLREKSKISLKTTLCEKK